MWVLPQGLMWGQSQEWEGWGLESRLLGQLGRPLWRQGRLWGPPGCQLGQLARLCQGARTQCCWAARKCLHMQDNILHTQPGLDTSLFGQLRRPCVGCT